ncbi:MAG: hypothetical protein H7Z17_04385 [Fuerstia sp.]|nr:hypothetical protein [Fuerstiella sp.]
MKTRTLEANRAGELLTDLQTLSVAWIDFCIRLPDGMTMCKPFFLLAAFFHDFRNLKVVLGSAVKLQQVG